MLKKLIRLNGSDLLLCGGVVGGTFLLLHIVTAIAVYFSGEGSSLLLSGILLPFVAGAALACTAAGAAASLTGAGLLPSLGLKVATAALCYTAWVRWWDGPLLDECLTYLLKKKTT